MDDDEAYFAGTMAALFLFAAPIACAVDQKNVTMFRTLNYRIGWRCGGVNCVCRVMPLVSYVMLRHLSLQRVAQHRPCGLAIRKPPPPRCRLHAGITKGLFPTLVRNGNRERA